MAITRLGPNNSTNISDINLTSQVTGTLPTGNGGTGATSFSPGKVLQVVTASTQTQVNDTSGSHVDTGLTCNITPSSTSSQILIIINQVFAKSNADNFIDARVVRDGSDISSNGGRSIAYTGDSGYLYPGVSFSYTKQDSPNTTSQVTYKVTFKRAGSGSGTVRANVDSGASTIALLEIAG